MTGWTLRVSATGCTERYIPKQKSGQEWVYDLKFYGIESLVRRFLVLETTDGNTEPGVHADSDSA